MACALAAAAQAAEIRPWAGGAAPALALRDLGGREHRLADYRGKVVLVNFWATWCAPCREELPSMRRLRAALAGRPFEILAVNLAEPASRVEKFLAAAPLDFPVLLDRDTQTARAWNARILPASYLVDRTGRVRLFVVGELDWMSAPARRAVERLLE